MESLKVSLSVGLSETAFNSVVCVEKCEFSVIVVGCFQVDV